MFSGVCGSPYVNAVGVRPIGISRCCGHGVQQRHSGYVGILARVIDFSQYIERSEIQNIHAYPRIGHVAMAHGVFQGGFKLSDGQALRLDGADQGQGQIAFRADGVFAGEVFFAEGGYLEPVSWAKAIV